MKFLDREIILYIVGGVLILIEWIFLDHIQGIAIAVFGCTIRTCRSVDCPRLTCPRLT